jgi:hypothetical protein
MQKRWHWLAVAVLFAGCCGGLFLAGMPHPSEEEARSDADRSLPLGCPRAPGGADIEGPAPPRRRFRATPQQCATASSATGRLELGGRCGRCASARRTID